MLAEALVRPAFFSVPEHASSAGGEAADLACSIGLTPDPEQRLALDAVLAERADGSWAAFETAIVAPRQNIKTFVYELCVLHDLFVRGVDTVVWTAHRFKTTRLAFNDFVSWVTNFDHLRRRVRKVIEGNGEESIVLLSGSTLVFLARSKAGGRGLGGAVTVLDEALFLQPTMMGALLPILAARPNPQVRYGSSACLVDSDVLRGIVERGRAGGDPSLAFAEWCMARGLCADDGCDHALDRVGCSLDDMDLLRSANTALGRRISERYIRNERRALPPAEFGRERAGWHDAPAVDALAALDVEQWLSLAAQPPELASPAFGVDLDEAGVGYFAVAWRRPDGLVHVQLAGRSTASKLQERATELTGKHGGRCFAGGPAVKLLDDCEAVSMEEFAAACRRLADMLAASEIRHSNEQELNDAVKVARWRSVSSQGGQAWQLKDAAGIGPLAAVTRALHGLTDESPPNIW